jgi:hypothetical protein
MKKEIKPLHWGGKIKKNTGEENLKKPRHLKVLVEVVEELRQGGPRRVRKALDEAAGSHARHVAHGPRVVLETSLSKTSGNGYNS